MKKCAFCAEEIQDEAIKCKHCGEMLTKAEVPADPGQAREAHLNTRLREILAPEKKIPTPQEWAFAVAIFIGVVGAIVGALIGANGPGDREGPVVTGIVVFGIVSSVVGYYILWYSVKDQPPAVPQPRKVLAYEGDCPHCGYENSLEPAVKDGLAASGKPLFCRRCKNAYTVNAQGAEFVKSTTSVVVRGST